MSEDKVILRVKEVVEVTGLSKSYIYQLSKEGKFPRPINLVPGGEAKGWVASEIHNWILERIAERDGVANVTE